MNAFLDWKHITFAQPLFFALLLFIPLLIWWYVRGKKDDSPSLRLTTISGLDKSKAGGKARLRPILFVLRIIALMALSVALARPQTSNTTENIDTEGIDIVLALDISGSMLAEDFRPNRIEAAKGIAIKFVNERPTDRIGLVIFASQSLTMCPITIDHNVLKEQIASLKIGMLEQQTGIGLGLATAVDRLRRSVGKSKVVILMTDGVNNVSTPVSPLSALEIAKVYKTKVYTIGIGTNAGEAPISVPTPMGPQKQMMKVEIDEALLRQISAETGGKYFRATSNKSLENVYQEIDKLEKTRADITSYKHYAELFFPFALLAIICLALEMFLRYTIFRSIT
jgi:Ca-activated chloride channel family protein